MKMIRQPTKEEVRAARRLANHTQAVAAETVHLTKPQRWHEYEAGDRNMDVSRWELYLLLTGQHPSLKVNIRKVPKRLDTTLQAAMERREPEMVQESPPERGEAVPC